jgi:hypothetical protein
MAKILIRGRCPCCGWELSPGQWGRDRGDDSWLGLMCYSLGRARGFASSPITTVENIEVFEPGLVARMSGRLIAAVGRWVRRGVIPLRDVLNTLPVHFLGDGTCVLDFERVGKRAVERVAVDFDMAVGSAKVLYQREVKPIAGREVKSYGWG